MHASWAALLTRAPVAACGAALQQACLHRCSPPVAALQCSGPASLRPACRESSAAAFLAAGTLPAACSIPCSLHTCARALPAVDSALPGIHLRGHATCPSRAASRLRGRRGFRQLQDSGVTATPRHALQEDALPSLAGRLTPGCLGTCTGVLQPAGQEREPAQPGRHGPRQLQRPVRARAAAGACLQTLLWGTSDLRAWVSVSLCCVLQRLAGSIGEPVPASGQPLPRAAQALAWLQRPARCPPGMQRAQQQACRAQAMPVNAPAAVQVQGRACGGIPLRAPPLPGLWQRPGRAAQRLHAGAPPVALGLTLQRSQITLHGSCLAVLPSIYMQVHGRQHQA